MSNMKLIMEGWRQYNTTDEQYEEVVNYILSNHGMVLSEGMLSTIKDKISDITNRYGKRAVTAALAAAIVTNTLAPSVAAAAETVSGPDLPVAAQQMDAEEAKKIIDMSEVGQELKDIFGKDGKISNLLKKKATDAPEEDPAPAEEARGELLGMGTSIDASVAKDMAYTQARANGYKAGDDIIEKVTMNPDPDFGSNYGTYTYTIHKAPPAEAN